MVNKKRLLYLILFFLASLVILVVNNFNLFGGCRDEIKFELKSPDGKVLATLFERDCGATTDFSTIVSLRESNRKFKPNSDSNVLILIGRNPVIGEWIDNNTLLLTYSTNNVFKINNAWCQIQIKSVHSE